MMPSPFPGMDPWLEEPSGWPDFHSTFLVFLRGALSPGLPERYAAYLDQYVWLEDAEEESERGGKPDLFVSERGGDGTALSAAAIVAPATQNLPARLRRGARYLRIVDRGSRRVATIIELLSPSNKGADREAYEAKRRDVIATRTNLVEIDLLRSGHRPPPRSTTPYRILISRASDFPRADVWGFGVRDPIPVIPVPLDPGVPPAPLDLKPSLDRAYDEGNFGRDIEYTRPPTPALSPADADWAAALLARRPPPGASAPGSP